MPEWLKDLIVAVGGGTVVLVGVLTIFKKLFVKLFETGIESSFEKSLEKYRNKLLRTTKAYEILLDREMRFYEKIDPIIAEMVPLEHDLCYCLKSNENIEHATQCEGFKSHLKRYRELCVTLKNEALTHRSYLPDDVYQSYADIVFLMQKDVYQWVAMGKLMIAKKYEEIDYNAIEEVMNTFFKHLANAELTTRTHLQELCGDNLSTAK